VDRQTDGRTDVVGKFESGIGDLTSRELLVVALFGRDV
jgi:hypothetical protein